MGFRRAAVNLVLKRILDIICKIDDREFRDALFSNKPLLVAINHINFLEVPILMTHSYPLYVTGLAKAETWRNPIFAFLFNTYRIIPIDRDGSYRGAFMRIREAIDNGFYACIAPEGTRSKNGVLGQGRAGIVQLALETDAPILPIVHFGGEKIWKNLRRFRRTRLCIKAGKPFKIRFDGRPGKETRGEILSEVMGQIARLLPTEMRGVYAEQAEKESKYLDFI